MQVQGRVKFWNEKRGFGILIRDTDGEEVFCHVTQLRGGHEHLLPDQPVKFSVGNSLKGLFAKHVRVIG